VANVVLVHTRLPASVQEGSLQIDHDIKLHRDINGRNRETIRLSFRVTAKRSRLLLAALVGDGLGSKGTLSEVIALAQGAGTLPALGEVEVTILEVGSAILDVRPVKPALLLVAALVVGVLWRCERFARKVPSSSGLLGSQTGEKSVSSPHGE
jgi:hypothetical protein